MKLLDRAHIISILFIAGGSLFLSFYSLFVLRIFMAIGVSVLVIVLVIKTSGFLRISYLSFLILGLLLNLLYKIDFDKVLDAYNSYTLFIALFVFTPLIKIPIETGGYIDKLIPKLTHHSNDSLSPVIILSNFVLGSFINIGGIRVIGETFQDYMKDSPQKFAALLSRPFSSAAFWTPYFSSFSIAVQYSHGSPVLILSIGLLFSLIVISLWTCMLTKRSASSKRMSFSTGEKRTFILLVIYFMLLVLSVILLTHFTTIDVITIISLTSIVYSFVWCVVSKRFTRYKRALKKFSTVDLLHIREEAFLFVSIGFFANTLLNIGWKLHLPVLSGNSLVYVFLFILLFNLIVVSISLTGIHHLVMITIFSSGIAWESLGVVPVVYGLTILLSWGLSIMVSPFSPPNIIIAKLTNKSPFQIGVSHNGLFGLCILIGGATYLTIVNSILGGL